MCSSANRTSLADGIRHEATLRLPVWLSLGAALTLAGCAKFTTDIASKEAYVSQVDESLMPRESALDFIKRHFDLRNGDLLCVAYWRWSGLNPALDEAKWVSIQSCRLKYVDFGHITVLGGQDYEANFLEILTCDEGRVFSSYGYTCTGPDIDVPGRMRRPKGITPGEVSDINRKLAAAFSVLGMQVLPPGPFDRNKFCRSQP